MLAITLEERARGEREKGRERELGKRWRDIRISKASPKSTFIVCLEFKVWDF